MRVFVAYILKFVRIFTVWRSGSRPREAREIRKRHADWKFIESLSPRLKAVLLYYIETGGGGILGGRRFTPVRH